MTTAQQTRHSSPSLTKPFPSSTAPSSRNSWSLSITSRISLRMSTRGFDSQRGRAWPEELYLVFDSVSDGLDEDVRNVVWNSLKKLSIGYVILSDGVIKKILAGSPVLEVLELYNYGGFSRLNPGDTIDGEYNDERLRYRLLISGHWRFPVIPRNCQLRNLASLVDATLDCDLETFDDDREGDNEGIQYTLRGLVESLIHVKDFIRCSGCKGTSGYGSKRLEFLTVEGLLDKILAKLHHLLSAEHCPQRVQLNEMLVLLTEIQARQQRQYETMEHFMSSQQQYIEKLDHALSEFCQRFGPPPQ
ncbi:hypothetical protein C3L33_06299, partial [Rhododendron williamsianum]